MLNVALRQDAEFERVYATQAPRALAAAKRVLRDEAAAEDVVQDVFLHLWNQPGGFDPKRGSLSTYVTLLARSRAIDRLRSRNTREAAGERFADHSRVVEGFAERAASEEAIDRDESRRLVRALDTLPTAQREALLLAYAYGMSSEQIARIAKIPLGTAKSRVRLGLEKTRLALDMAA